MNSSQKGVTTPGVIDKNPAWIYRCPLVAGHHYIMKWLSFHLISVSVNYRQFYFVKWCQHHLLMFCFFQDAPKVHIFSYFLLFTIFSQGSFTGTRSLYMSWSALIFQFSVFVVSTDTNLLQIQGQETEKKHTFTFCVKTVLQIKHH